MLVSELIQKLKAMPQNKPIVLCNLEDDGDGDGLANLHEIVSVGSIAYSGRKYEIGGD